MKKVLWIVVGVLVLVVLYAVSMNGQKMDSMNSRGSSTTRESDAMMKKDEAMMDKDAMMQEDDSMMKKDDEVMIREEDAMMKKDDTAMVKVSGKYAVYSESAVAEALKSGKNVALFFHATWCGSCKSADAALTASTPADNLVVFKTDYDTYTELKKKYGVTYQHTFVALNSDGTMKKKISGAESFSEIEAMFR